MHIIASQGATFTPPNDLSSFDFIKRQLDEPQAIAHDIVGSRAFYLAQNSYDVRAKMVNGQIYALLARGIVNTRGMQPQDIRAYAVGNNPNQASTVIITRGEEIHAPIAVFMQLAGHNNYLGICSNYLANANQLTELGELLSVMQQAHTTAKSTDKRVRFRTHALTTGSYAQLS